MKTSLRSTRVVIWILAGLVVIMTAIALTIPTSPAQISAAAGELVGVDSSDPQDATEVGSTDGIVMLAALIALIITVPVILRWRDWIRTNNKPAPQDQKQTPS
jgi:hypothetical protein